MQDISLTEKFSFRGRPTPVPGDLRINWRIAVLLLILLRSRSKKASLAKLYVLSDALRSPQSRQALHEIQTGERARLMWRIRVEPALARAVDLLVGEGFATWIKVSGRMGVQLTPRGAASAEAVSQFEDGLEEEKSALQQLAPATSESFVTSLLSTNGSK